jgi:hypothetical protein
MPRKVKRGNGCAGSTRRSRRGRGRKSLEVLSRKRVYGCGSRKRRQSRKRMRGGFNEQALQEVLDAALSSTSGGALSGARLNGGQGGGSRRQTKRARRSRKARRSMRGGMENNGALGAADESAQSAPAADESAQSAPAADGAPAPGASKLAPLRNAVEKSICGSPICNVAPNAAGCENC